MHAVDPLPPLPAIPLRLARLEAFVFRWPIETPVRTSFGTMRDRPAVFVRAEDVDGAVGWGEAWCNFPSCAAEHRANLVTSLLAPLLVGQPFASATEAFRFLSTATAVLAIQSGEPGPIGQAIAGVDIALWDLAARRVALPLWRLLGGSSDRIGVYASGINPERPQDTVAAKFELGHRAFKLKVGFGAARDLDNIGTARRNLGDAASLMVDANQAWSFDEAHHMARALEDFALGWIEEPLRADRPLGEWQALASATPTPLAGGENMIGESVFDAALGSGAFGVVQPDVAKWGGISGGWPVIGRIRAAGKRYCPHFLGAGVGLLASGHLLAAAGGDGRLEIDANANPLRELLCGEIAEVHDGGVRLGDRPGLGMDVDLTGLRALCAAG
jgi:L-alanine-DL-glutamate epimerase-like enolase superfamily enzyme